MRKKSFKLWMTMMLGVIICLCYNKVQAAEITSVFTGEKINRETVQTIETTQRISSTSITIVRKESGYTYEGGTKKLWDFYDQNKPEDKYYCLNEKQGFNDDAATKILNIIIQEI